MRDKFTCRNFTVKNNHYVSKGNQVIQQDLHALLHQISGLQLLEHSSNELLIFEVTNSTHVYHSLSKSSLELFVY